MRELLSDMLFEAVESRKDHVAWHTWMLFEKQQLDDKLRKLSAYFYYYCYYIVVVDNLKDKTELRYDYDSID